MDGGFLTMPKTPGDERWEAVVLSTKVDADEGQLTVSAIFMNGNRQLSPEDRIRATDLLYTDWRGATNEAQAKNLRLIHREQIEMYETQSRGLDGQTFKLNTPAAMNEVWRHAWELVSVPQGRRKVKDVTLRSPTGSGANDISPEEAKLFHLMAAQTHVDRVYSLLRDHPQGLGDKTITKVVLQQPNAVEGSMGKTGESHIFIHLGPRPQIG